MPTFVMYECLVAIGCHWLPARPFSSSSSQPDHETVVEEEVNNKV